MSDNTEWLIEFKDNSYFRLSENKFYIKNQKNYEVCQDNNEKNYGGMKEMDFCYCHDMHIDLIECKKSDSPSKRALREDCTDKALHSSALLKTALYSKNNYIFEVLNKLNKNYSGDEELKIYIIFEKLDAKSKTNFIDVSREIEGSIKKFLICPLGKMWNIKEVQVLDYKTAKKKLEYIK
ncbi:hypothetical protein [uncultured Brachyspira sp.]|uniref:hypothetical protein n=1 Tax=uncultured Brachyspira sp. TaxID=221953 RepID=UPI0025DE5494|nr:hypothetical protein [uncultured Brachyspira sp.]